MARVFDRNMFIMLLSIMAGVIIITFFIADIQARTSVTKELTTKYTADIKDIETKNINFTNSFIQSLGLLDLARGFMASGSYNFDLAMIWYTTALSETNATSFETYKSRTISNCDDAIYNYTYCYENFIEARNKFERTKAYINYQAYLNILDLYVNLTTSGSNLALLRKNASLYLKYLAENLTMENGAIVYLTNITNLSELFNETVEMYENELAMYNELEKAIEREYNIIGFSEIREEG